MEVYKSGQGSLARLTSLTALVILAALGAYELYSWIHTPGKDQALLPGDLFRQLPILGVPFSWKFLLCLAVFVAMVWGIRHYMARASTADVLIETESELKKVSWPTTAESKNATLVVVLVTVLLTGLLFVFDIVLRLLFELIF